MTETSRVLLLVDRRETFARLGDVDRSLAAPIVLACAEGGRTPPEVRALDLHLAGGGWVPILYLHDAATVLYPFAMEPIATLLKAGRFDASLYVDLGLPPTGATPRRFDDPTLPPGALVFELSRIPTTTLWRYCVAEARRLLSVAERGGRS